MATIKEKARFQVSLPVYDTQLANFVKELKSSRRLRNVILDLLFLYQVQRDKIDAMLIEAQSATSDQAIAAADIESMISDISSVLAKAGVIKKKEEITPTVVPAVAELTTAEQQYKDDTINEMKEALKAMQLQMATLTGELSQMKAVAPDRGPTGANVAPVQETRVQEVATPVSEPVKASEIKVAPTPNVRQATQQDMSADIADILSNFV